MCLGTLIGMGMTRIPLIVIPSGQQRELSEHSAKVVMQEADMHVGFANQVEKHQH